LLTQSVARRARRAAILAALLLAVAALARLGPTPAPAAPGPGTEARPDVHQPAPAVVDRAPGAVASSAGDGVAAPSPPAAPIGVSEPTPATARAGGASGGVLGDRGGGR
jgi:hypothetical protein